MIGKKDNNNIYLSQDEVTLSKLINENPWIIFGAELFDTFFLRRKIQNFDHEVEATSLYDVV